MNESELLKRISTIEELDELALKEARERESKLAKPPGSLGRLEDYAVQLAGITGKVKNDLAKKRILVFAADNGIVAENISSAPRSVTAMQAVNMTKYKTGMSSMAKHFGVEVEVHDVGIADPYTCEKVIQKRIAFGTKNIANEDAMTRDECVRAVEIGIEAVKKAREDGVRVIGVGEMGIGNTSTSTMVLAALTGVRTETVTGRGGGLTDDGFARKKEILAKALSERNPDKTDVIDVISKVGGFDIAAMCGAFLGAGIYRVPAVIDGFISIVAALCAVRLNEKARNYLFTSHESFEPGYKLAAEELHIAPMFSLGMRLGEGSGCPIAFQVLEGAVAHFNDMALFGEESDINDDYLDEIRKGDSFSV